MGSHRVLVLAGVLALMPAGTASAWEFSMQGSLAWEYILVSQAGTNGFLGPFDVDNGKAGKAGSLNGWVGQRLGDLVSGSEGALNVEYMITNMDLRINPAVRIRGSYYIGEWKENGTADGSALGKTVASQYLNNRHPGIQRSFSPGYWNTLWVTAQLPWGIVTLGKRPSTFGMGLQFNGEENRSSESLALTADYGPMRIQLSFYPARRGSGTNSVPVTPPADSASTNFDYYNNDFDKNNIRLWEVALPSVTYRSGPLDMGLLVNFVRTHRGREGQLVTSETKVKVPSRDRDDFYGDLYLKYNNGRLFWNSEFSWFNRIDRFSGNATISPASLAPVYIEAYGAATEMGALVGPAKISFLYAWMNGPDRRNGRTAGINQGAFVDHVNSSGTNLNPRVASQSGSNTGLFRPYSFLMVYSYGLGAYIEADTNNGFADDASMFAARLDHAVAANLNVYGSFFRADRVGNGYGWGYLSPLDRSGALTTNGQIFGLYRGSATPGNAAIRPTIPEKDLGWEINAGLDWKLLEGFVVATSFAYWQPGKWFNYACVDKSVIGWDTQSAFQGGVFPFGVNPDRTIDPIWGLDLKVTTEF
jgi:hypothetical protein